jgi:hypothetical protein
MFFLDRTSQSALAGFRLDWQPPALTTVPSVRLSVVKDLVPLNAMSAWRTTVPLAATF